MNISTRSSNNSQLDSGLDYQGNSQPPLINEDDGDDEIGEKNDYAALYENSKFIVDEFSKLHQQMLIKSFLVNDNEISALLNMPLATKTDEEALNNNLFCFLLSAICHDFQENRRLSDSIETVNSKLAEIAVRVHTSISDALDNLSATENIYLKEIAPYFENNDWPASFKLFMRDELTKAPKGWSSFDNKEFVSLANSPLDIKIQVYNGNRLYKRWKEIQKMINACLAPLWPSTISSTDNVKAILSEVRWRYLPFSLFEKADNAATQALKRKGKDAPPSRLVVQKEVELGRALTFADKLEIRKELAYQRYRSSILSFKKVIWYPNEWLAFVMLSLPAGDNCCPALRGDGPSSHYVKRRKSYSVGNSYQYPIDIDASGMDMEPETTISVEVDDMPLHASPAKRARFNTSSSAAASSATSEADANLQKYMAYIQLLEKKFNFTKDTETEKELLDLLDKGMTWLKPQINFLK